MVPSKDAFSRDPYPCSWGLYLECCRVIKCRFITAKGCYSTEHPCSIMTSSDYLISEVCVWNICPSPLKLAYVEPVKGNASAYLSGQACK